MNPRNGMCMCVLHDKAFDRGLMSITDNYKVLLSASIKKLSNELAVQRGFLPYDGIEVRLPNKFIPDKQYIKFHRNNIFISA
jgi:putative restriction endonuclease